MAQRPVTLADIVRGHVSLEIEGFDRLYFNGWVPALQMSGQIAGWVFDATKKDGPDLDRGAFCLVRVAGPRAGAGAGREGRNVSDVISGARCPGALASWLCR
jgi:hypothetical protein